MSEDEPEISEDKKSSVGAKLGIWGVVFALGIGTGIAVSVFVLPSQSTAASNLDGIERMDIPEPDDKIAFVEFAEVVVNLNDERVSRYATSTFSLQVAASQQMAIQKLVEEKEAVLTNWLIAHMRDKKLEEVSGKLGLNTIRREIHDEFNRVLFTDGIERIQDVLFRDFKVQ